MKRRVTIMTIIAVLVIAIVALTGCASMPSDIADLLATTHKSWTNAKNKSITDELTVSNINISAPIKYSGLPYTVQVKDASMYAKITREIKGDDSVMTFLVKDIDVAPIQLISSILKIDHNELKKVVITGSLAINSTAMTLNLSVTNIENVMPDIEKIEDIVLTFARSEHGALVNSIAPLISQSTFGNISDAGTYDKKNSTYNYAIDAKNVNGELFKVFKILLDSCGDLAIDDAGNTISGGLNAIFGDKNLINIVNGILMPTDSLKVGATIGKTGSKYYFTQFRGIHSAKGIITKEAGNNLLKMLEDSDPMVKEVSVTKDITVAATIAIKTVQKIL